MDANRAGGDLARYLAAAREAAAAAARLIETARPAGNAALEVEYKADRSPVTAADRAAERCIRERLAVFAGHRIYGEEYGAGGAPEALADCEFVWLVDPIDGTRSFIRGMPFYSVQIALLSRGELILGVSCAPAFGETAWAVRGGGAWLNGARLKVSACATLDDAWLSTGNLKWPADSARWPRLGRLISSATYARGYGDFYSYHRLAAGALDLVLEQGVNILDIAALAVIVSEAGGVFTDLTGRPPAIGCDSVLAASTPALHRQALEFMRA